ncbi:MAG: T9SS type A sorting domain-containing protein [Bacteroidales bacterium]|nr:T9SS type A sorting domain-containing protein [Bacteroidales bacterium]
MYNLFIISNLFAIDAPTLTSPDNGKVYNTTVQPTVKWNTVSGATKYMLEWDTIASFTSPLYDLFTTTSNSVYLDGLLYGTKYYWRVRAIDESANDTSAYSVVRNFTTASKVLLSSPDNDTNTNATYNTIRTFEWNNCVGSSSYIFQLDTTPSFNSDELFVSNVPSSTTSTINYISTTIQNMLYGTMYYWRVCAVNASDTSGWSAIRQFHTNDKVTLSSPTNNSTGSNTLRTFEWNNNKGSSSYIFQLDTTPNFNSNVLFVTNVESSTTNTATNISWSIRDMLYGTTHYWRVCAVNAVDTSGWSAIWHFTTNDKVTLYSPSNNSTGISVASRNMQWNNNKGSSSYILQVDTTTNFNSDILRNINVSSSYNNTTTYISSTISTLLSGTTYFWRVCAVNAEDTSGWSNVWRFTTAYQLTTAPTLVSPANGSTEIAPSGVELVWNELDNVTGYRYQVATDNAFASIVRSGTTAGTSVSCNLMYGTTYYWRVQGYNASGNSVWSAVWNFSTQDCQQLTGETSATACSSYLWHGTTYTESGNYTITLPQSNGCDSVLTLHLTINHPLAELVEATACDSYEWNGETYTESGTYEKTFTAFNGCDSVVTLHLTINHPLAEFVEAEACDSYEWNGETYTESGTYYKTFTASNGCDSVVTLQLTINESPARDFSAVACGSYVWNNQTYTESGIYEQNIASNGGCDSIITLHLTINHPQTELVEATACSSYEWNGETYTESGTYEKTFTASNGCDSVVTLHLTVNHPQTELVEATACSSYEWNGETYTESGTYEKTFTASNGCDSVVTLHLTINHPQTELVEATACDSYEWNGETYTETGTYERTFTAGNGCDSVVTLHLTINNSVHYSFTETATSPYTWNGTEYTETGNYTQNFTVANGCDSIVTLHLNILSGISQNGTAEISVFPNPATDILNITSSETIFKIEIVNVMGQVVKRIEVNADNAVCNVEELKAGVYVVRIHTEGTVVSQQKFIKE